MGIHGSTSQHAVFDGQDLRLQRGSQPDAGGAVLVRSGRGVQTTVPDPRGDDMLRHRGQVLARADARAILEPDFAALFARPIELGIMGLRQRIKARCGAFSARDKEGNIRFICGARQAPTGELGRRLVLV